MKKFIMFLFLFVLLFSLFCYAQSDTAKIDAAQNELSAWDKLCEWFDKNKYNLKDKLKSPGQKFNTADGNEYLFSFLENNSQLFKSEKEMDILFNNIKNNPEVLTVLENNPELVNTINENPQLFFNVLLDDQELKSFINNPTEYTSKKWGVICKLPILRIEEISKKSTVELWQDWGIMK